ncbi:MAG: FKBP-type peptidyl-prolyl cis-trans isomerase [Bernardetiaceae bacterium]|nr:FKBP-type peptidyl-prolyl cis-trans isomerase [Bernardetiaceae bacterium]
MQLNVSLWLKSLLALIVIGSSACQNSETGEFTTKSGLKYIVHERGEGKSPSDSTFVEMDLILDIKKDTILAPELGPGIINNTYVQGIPAFIDISMDPGLPMAYIIEMLKESKVGDSVTAFIHIDSLFSGTPVAQRPPFYEPDMIVEARIRIQNFYTPEEFEAKSKEMQERMMKKQQEQMQKQQEEMAKAEEELQSEEFKAEETARIESYIQEKGLKTKTTQSGLYYAIEKQGTDVEKGVPIKIHYKGTLLDGTPFDSSYDRGEPIEIPIGEGRVIQGWDEGIPLIGKGGKGTLIIPASLGYGARGQGPIPPKSALVFEVEVL